jgi:predicted DNA-binding transcriptional regulator AlpA
VPAVATFNISDGPETFLSTRQVRAMIGGVSRMWIHRRQLDAGFPRGIHLGGGKLVFYKLSEVQAWVQASNHPTPLCNAPGFAP